MADISFTMRDGTPVMDSPPPAAPVPSQREQIRQIGRLGWGEGASNLEFDNYKQQSQAAIDAAVAASRAAEGGEPDGNVPVVDAGGAVVPVATDGEWKAFYDDQHFYTPDDAVALQQEWAGDGRANLGYANHAISMALTAEEFAYARQLGIDLPAFYKLAARVGRRLVHGGQSSDNTGQTAMTTNSNVPADIDAQIEQADLEFYRAHDKFDRPGMARADAKRQELYRMKHPGSIVDGLGRTL